MTYNALQQIPGGDLIQAGLEDLAQGRETIPALLVSIGAPRLRRLGVPVSHEFPSPETRLYQILHDDTPNAAHSRYNALIRRLVSFERTAQCVR